MARLVDSEVTKLVWLAGAADTIADIKAPTLAELTDAVDITCYVLKNYEVRADASDTTDESAVCDSAAGAVPTRKKYTGNLPLFRDFVTATGIPDTTDLLAVFHEDYPQGYFIRRVGKPQEAAFAAADVLDIYHFSGDVPQIQGGTGEGFLKMTVPLLPTGKFTTKAVVAAGG